MEQLSNELLIEAYEKARRLNLSEDFVSLIEKELERRAISVPSIGYEPSQKTYV